MNTDLDQDPTQKRQNDDFGLNPLLDNSAQLPARQGDTPKSRLPSSQTEEPLWFQLLNLFMGEFFFALLPIILIFFMYVASGFSPVPFGSIIFALDLWIYSVASNLASAQYIDGARIGSRDYELISLRNWHYRAFIIALAGLVAQFYYLQNPFVWMYVLQVIVALVTLISSAITRYKVAQKKRGNHE